MSSYKQNYLKSCFLTLILTLVYIVIVQSFILKEYSGEQSLIFLFKFSAAYLFLAGFIIPLTFFFSGKFTTHVKEPARPHIDSSIETKLPQPALQDIAKQAINSNPTTKARAVTQPEKETIPSQHKKQEIIDEEIVTVYIGNIPFKVNDNGLKDLFKPFGGTIYYAHLSRDAKTKKRKGIGFVKISKASGLAAIEKLNGSTLLGREIVVKIANERGNAPVLENLETK